MDNLFVHLAQAAYTWNCTQWSVETKEKHTLSHYTKNAKKSRHKDAYLVWLICLLVEHKLHIWNRRKWSVGTWEKCKNQNAKNAKKNWSHYMKHVIHVRKRAMKSIRSSRKGKKHHFEYLRFHKPGCAFFI